MQKEKLKLTNLFPKNINKNQKREKKITSKSETHPNRKHNKKIRKNLQLFITSTNLLHFHSKKDKKKS
jgi:hypothetical protein